MNVYNRQILQLALPSIVSNITVPLLGLVDVAIVGHIGDARYIAAIAIGSMIFNIMYWLFGFLRMGTSGMTAQTFGAQRMDEAMRLLRQSLVVAFTFAALILVFQVPLRWLSFFLMRPTADVASLAIPYFYIVIWGAPAMLGLYSLTGWFIGMQDTRTPMLISIIQNVVNILSSLLLVFVMGMRVEGVALGTIIAQWAGFLVAVVLLKRRYKGVCVQKQENAANGPTPNAPRLQNFTRFLAVNRDIFLRTLFLVAVNLFFTSEGAAQGAIVLAVNTLLMQLYLLFSYVMDGFAHAGEALSGRYYGAGDTRSLHTTISLLFRWGVAMVVLFTMVYALGGLSFLRLLTSDNAVIKAAVDYLPWALLVPATGVAAFIWDGVFIGLTRTGGMLWASAIAAIGFFLLYTVFTSQGLLSHLSLTMGRNHALWLSLIVYLSLRGIVQTWLFYKCNKNCIF